MQEENPYAAPQSEVKDVNTERGELAGRLARLGAVIIDGIILMFVAVPFMFMFGVFNDPTLYGSNIAITVGMFLLMFGAFVVINGYFLKTNGQTVGKKAMNIRIEDLNGNVAPVGKVIGLRYLLFWIITSIPLLGSLIWLVDVLFIFREDRRCVHDLVAGTRVVQV